MQDLTYPCFPANLMARGGISVQPLRDLLLVAKLPEDRLGQEGSIIVPGTSSRQRQVAHTWGQVIEVGPKVVDISKGDLVHWHEHSGMWNPYLPDESFGEQMKWDSHFDIDREGAFLAVRRIRQHSRRFLFIREGQVNMTMTCERGERIPAAFDV